MSVRGSLVDHDLHDEAGLQLDVFDLQLVVEQPATEVPSLVTRFDALKCGQLALGAPHTFFRVDWHSDVVLRRRQSELDMDLFAGKLLS